MITISRAHYEKMNKMYTKIRVLRHDYKYHLNAVSKLLAVENIEGIKQYVKELEAEISETEPFFFCSNPIINALFSYYAERCAKLNITFNVKLVMAERRIISDYELCIVFGNLLENAFDACVKIDKERCIELFVQTQGSQFGIMVSNSFNGEVKVKNERPVSIKEGGGFGLQSIQALVARYSGHTFFEWSNDRFVAYVMLQDIARKK
jgi:sensor histidine kinase regulating citrate/malate metabolism